VASKLSLFLAELKRRKVYHVAVVYVVVAAGIIGFAEPALGEAWESIRVPVVAFVLIGFPIALVLAWAYEVKPEEPRAKGAFDEETLPTRDAATPAEVTDKEQRKSIVVLPFDNMSPDPGDTYFSDGLTEEIITDLSHIHSLRVISRNSAMVLKGTQRGTQAIAQELDVQYVLEGSVRKAGDNLRITAQLIDAPSDEHLWAEKYDGSIGDVFEIQEEVSRSIVETLRVKLSPEEDQRISKRPIDNLQAYECYLKAYQEIFQYTEESFHRAVRLLRNGLELVGENELLYEAMGNAHLQQINFMVSPDESYLHEAKRWAKKLLELNPGSSRGYFLDGLIRWKRGNWKEGIRQLRESLSLDQANPRALEYLVYLHSLAGKVEKSREYLPKLLELEPLVPLYHCFPGWIDELSSKVVERP
jgi:TolB-like protein